MAVIGAFTLFVLVCAFDCMYELLWRARACKGRAQITTGAHMILSVIFSLSSFD